MSRCICAECGHFSVVNLPKSSFGMKNQSQAKGFAMCFNGQFYFIYLFFPMGNFKHVKGHYQMIYVGKLF